MLQSLVSEKKIDCDVHVTLPTTAKLLPYLSEYWREQVTSRGIDRLELTSDLSNIPAAVRPDWKGAGDLDAIRAQALDPFGTDIAICNCLYGAQAVYNHDLAAALCGAMNDWLAEEWLGKDERLRGSVIVPWQHPEAAAREIERWASDRRFVQVQLMLMGEMPLGRRAMWPIYAAAEAHGFAVAVHAGTAYRFAPWTNGWPSFHIEDQAALSVGFQTQLLSMIAEGVFEQHPKLKVVLTDSGVTWLPAFLWRIDKLWRGLRMEVPWLKRPPSEVVSQHVRMTLQPFDGPKDTELIAGLIEQIGEHMLLFSTDYPRWNFDGTDAVPLRDRPELMRKLRTENPFETYVRLREG
ncbi:amidohydrolase family protein [Bradyrhizobium erythrophlei]|uniref:amidohydrolase family protein n=1 Tax=Bradyrhizobium erythrophlei TaxID=1437360 RepID=UPI0035EDA1FA